MQQQWFTRVGSALLLASVTTVVLALVPDHPAGAADQTLCHDAALARGRTEIDADMVVPRFDPALGTLLEVSVPTQSVHLDTDSKFENTAASSVVFAEQMTYQATFASPAGLASPPTVSGTIQRVPSQTLAAFDGTLDFAGVSAVTQPSTTRDADAAPVSSTDPATLATFTGSGTMAFHVATVIGEAFTGGGGNVQAEINTFGAADVQVCYRYAPPPPTTSPPTTSPPTTAPPESGAPPPARRPPALAPPVPLPAPPAFTG